MKKLFTLVVALVATLSINATDLYVIGTINSWALKDANYKMTETKTDAEWTFSFGATDLAGQKFKINDGDWADTYNLGKGTDALTEGTISLFEGGADINLASQYNSATNVTITLKKDAEGNFTLTATGTFTTGEKTIPDLYLRGGDDEAWGAVEEHKFTVVKTGAEWALTYNVDPEAFAKNSFKIADANWGEYNFGAGADPQVKVDEAYTLVSGSSVNLTLADGIEAGTYKFTLTKNGDEWTLLLTTASADAINNVEAAEKVVLKKTLKGIIKGDHMYNYAGSLLK